MRVLARVHHRRDRRVRRVWAFQLNLENDRAIKQRQCFIQCRDPFAIARIKLTNFSEGEVGDFSRPGGRAINRRVVHQNQMSILGELHVDLDLIDPKRDRPPDRTKGVFWFQRTSTAM